MVSVDCKMTLNFNSRYAMKCNFIANFGYIIFIIFLGKHAPRRPKKFSSLCLKHFWGVQQISHSFLTSKLDRSDISANVPNFLHSLIISGMKCCTHNSNLRYCSDLKYKHHTLVIILMCKNTDYTSEFVLLSHSVKLYIR